MRRFSIVRVFVVLVAVSLVMAVMPTPGAATDDADAAAVAGWRFQTLPGLDEADDPKGRTDELPVAIASGEHGLVAVGRPTCLKREGCHGRVWHSPDGEIWSAVPLRDGLRTGRTPGYGFGYTGPVSVADGPAGYVAIGVARWRTRAGEPRPDYGLWRSSDGMTWRRSKALPFGPAFHPRSIVATPERYIVSGTQDTGRDLAIKWPEGSEPGGRALQQRPVAWSSDDGRTWERTRLPGGNSGVLGPASAAPGGVVIPGALCKSRPRNACYWSSRWNFHHADGARGAIWRSPDGQSWTREMIAGWEPGHGSSEFGWGTTAAILGDRVVVPGGVLDEGAFQPWDPPPGLLTPSEDQDAVPLLATVGDHVVMLGASLCGWAAWISPDGTAWQLLPELPFPERLLREPLRDLAVSGGDDGLIVSGWAEADSSGFVLSASEAWLTSQPAATSRECQSSSGG